MFVTYLKRGQGFRECCLIELRVSPRPGYRPYVDDEAYIRLSQQIDKFDDRPGRVAYGEKGVRGVAPSGERRVTDRLTI
jgi:hypothetical protein